MPPRSAGGEFGKVYRAYAASLQAGDVKAARALLGARVGAYWQKMEKAGKLDGYVEYTWKEKHLGMKNPRVTGGFVDGDRAVLLVKGESGIYGSLHGDAILTREDGKWRLSDELLNVE